MSYDEQKEFFETAYRTGSDIWTDKHYHAKIFEYLGRIPNGGMVLDLGTGRGRWPFTMVEMGFKVIGIDYIDKLIKVNNHEAKAKNMQGKIRFVEGDVFDIKFADQTFDVVTDFGLLQHMKREDWDKYGAEVSRVLKGGGYVLNVSLAKDTPRFLDFSPSDSMDNDFEKYGVHYHFFTPEEIRKVYGFQFKVVTEEKLFLEKEKEVLLVTLLKKN